MNPSPNALSQLTRRSFLSTASCSVGSLALSQLLLKESQAASTGDRGLPGLPHFAPKAKRVVCLFQSGGLSHVDLFDDKPTLHQYAGKDIPASIKGEQRLTGMTSGQSAYPVLPALKPGKFCGQSGRWISDLLPHTQSIADEICVLKTLHSEAINHDPGVTYFNTGNQLPGYASMGSWISYGLGSLNDNLPAFIALVSQGTGKNPGQPIFSRLWGSGFLPSSHQGVGLRPGRNPVLYLENPPGVQPEQRRALLDDLQSLNQTSASLLNDPETQTRIAAYEMAFRLQTSVPDLTDISTESATTLQAYGPEVTRPGTYAANCLLARRLLERDVRFVQLYHRGWDQHINITSQLPNQCRDVDQPSAALIKDLKQRGLLEDTLVIFATEFGRTTFSQGAFGSPGMGRDHHGRCFSIWMAGGGIQSGIEYGKTDDFCYNIAENPVHLRDLHATLMHCLGIDHQRLSYRFRGLHTRLTGVEEAHVVKEILS
jgi:uncharacterized protein (DUF1501 family)